VLLKRIITGLLIFALAMVVIWFLPDLYFSLFILLITMIALSEFYGMVFSENHGIELKWVMVILSTGLLALKVFLNDEGLFGHLLMGFVFVGFIILLFFQKSHRLKIEQMAYGLLGLFYPGFFILYVIMIRNNFVQGRLLYIIMILCVSAADSFAFFGGSLFGKHKLCPTISPKKTVEGLISGLVGSLLFGFLFKFFFFKELLSSHVIVIATMCSIVGQMGDLVESMIKRAYDVKDSGKLLPGHGGILDRIDAQLYVAPIYYFYIKFFILK